jgi:F-type H+-transporting ATPase subunit b
MLDSLGINLWVTLVQFIFFMLLFVVMWRFFFTRIVDALHKREEAVDTILHDIDMKQKMVDQHMKDYTRRMQEIEQEATLKIQAAVKEGQKVKGEVEAEAKRRADEELARGKAQIQKEKEQAMAALQKEATRIAAEIAARVLQESVGSEARFPAAGKKAGVAS